MQPRDKAQRLSLESDLVPQIGTSLGKAPAELSSDVVYFVREKEAPAAPCGRQITSDRIAQFCMEISGFCFIIVSERREANLRESAAMCEIEASCAASRSSKLVPVCARLLLQ